MEHDRIIEELRRREWNVDQRFPWLPRDVRSVIENVSHAVSPDERAWFVTTTVMTDESDVAFSWDVWERQSLLAAASDEAWSLRIREFWDAHFPLMHSCMVSNPVILMA